MGLMVLVLNLQYTLTKPRATWDVPLQVTAAQGAALAELGRKAEYYVSLDGGVIPRRDWKEWLTKTCFNYTGAEVQKALPLSWAQVEPALPPFESCACVDV